MAKVKVYNMEGKAVGEEELDPKIFAVPIKKELVHEAMVAQTANARRVIAHTKGRAEVRGGGRKPWRQKGTGRARHGSIRSPIWVGGGVTFGPTKERNFKVKINKKAKRKALLMVLSDKAKDKKIVLLDKLELKEAKTKEMANVLGKLPVKGKKTLIALAKADKNIIRSAANLSQYWVTTAASLNVVDLLRYEFVLMPLESLKVVEKTFLNKEEAKK